MLPDRLFFKLLLVFLPAQLSTHFFYDFSLVLGLRIDYYSVQISLTDIFLLLTILFWFIRKGKEVYLKTIKKAKKNHLLLITFFIFLNLNLIISPSKELYFLKIFKLIELYLLSLYIYFEKISFKKVAKYLLIGGFYSSILAIGQFIRQSSLGGIWSFLGERTFSLMTPGIAKAEIFGRLYLRPYATFPHPNVLAGFLALNLPLLTIFSTKTKKEKLLFITVFAVLTISLFLTFSRVSFLVGLSGFIVMSFSIKRQTRFLFLTTLLVLLVVFGELIVGRFYNLFLGAEESFIQRYALIISAKNMFLLNPVFGIGLNNFIKFLPETANFLAGVTLLQPVHNTYFLILAEAGIVGFSLFILLLYKTYKKAILNFSIFTILFYQLLALLFFDHYFYTLQQGQLLFTILISYILKRHA